VELGGQLVTPPPVASPSAFTPTDLADGNALGAEDAPVTVEVWADYQCPYCALFTTQVEPGLIAQYVETGQARLVFRDLAFLGEESRWAAVAARLAEEQGAFWPYHDYLFANQMGENVGSYAIPRLQEIASLVGLDRSVFDAGLRLEAARETFDAIRTEFEADASRLGIRSTPTVVVNGTVVTGNDLAAIRAAIDAALAD
jgi:protein-disulfide isomerase